MKKYYTIVIALAVITPAVSFALLSGTASLLTAIGGLMNPIIAGLVGLGVVYFFWGMGQFILHAGDPKAIEEGRSKMIWGVVAIFVMVSIYGIISFLGEATGIKTNSNMNGGTYTPGDQY